MALRRFLLVVAATLVIAACGRATIPAGKACGANPRCPPGYMCVVPDGGPGAGTCMKVDGGADGPKSDGGRDAGAGSDVAVPDGSQGDGGGVVVPKVTVTIELSGNGTITGDGLSCTTGSCTVTVDSGSSLVLVANPGADSNFNSWSGCTSNNGASCSLVAIVASMQLTATFSIKGANLVVQKDGSGSGTVTATWAGGGTLACGASCSAVVPKGTVVTFQGTPDMGSALAWGAPCTGSGACMTTIGDGETDVKATFTLNQVVLTVNRTGNGTIVSSGGVTCSDPACPLQVNYGDSVTLTATPGADSDFGTWTGCASTTGAKCVVSSLKAAAAVTATFTLKKIQVTLSRSGNGTITSTDGAVNCTDATCVVSVSSGSSLSLTATAGADSNFQSWSGCTTTSGATCTLTGITAPIAASATFALKNASFVISKQGNGTGTVTATWAGGSLSCGAACSANIPQGTVVTIQGAPAAQSTLAFTGPCTGAGTCMVTVPAGGTTVVATFSLVKYALTVQATGSGTVTGTGVNCTTFPCAVSLDSGTSITLTAAALGQYLFSSWSGCSSTSGVMCTVTSIAAATTVTATFVLKKYPLTVQVSGNGNVTGSGVNCASASCVSNFDSGSTITLTANPGSDSDFKSWVGCTSTSGATCTVTSLAAATTVTATFGLKSASFNIAKNGNGAGTVTASWTGGGSLNCGTGCSASIPQGTSVTVTATPQTGSSAAIVGCATNPCTVTVAAGGTTVTATFTLNQYVLAVTLGGPSATGSVLSSVGINCSASTSPCSVLVNYGTPVSLTATASGSGVFTGWSGCTPTGSSPCSVTVTGATNVTANFKRAQGFPCGAGSDCTSNNFCVAGVCCDGACNGPCNTGTCAGGTCANKTGKPFCGYQTGPSGPKIGTDVAKYCQGNGACVAPTITCTGFSSVSCPLANNACCITSSSSSYVCVAPSSCLTPTSGDFFSGDACITGADCPDDYVCCNHGTIDQMTNGFWNECIPMNSSCSGTIQN
jgi:hypothetical protein